MNSSKAIPQIFLTISGTDRVFRTGIMIQFLGWVAAGVAAAAEE